MTVVDNEWPEGVERTPEGHRVSGSKFSTGIRRTKSDLKDEMERLDVSRWSLIDQTGSGGDPGVVLRWTKEAVDYVVACDGYKEKKANLRELYLWVNETRMREQRRAKTTQENFAAAREALPSGDEDVIVLDSGEEKEPYEVLEVAPDASEETIRAVARRKLANTHPDKNADGERDEYLKIQNAKEAMLDGS